MLHSLKNHWLDYLMEAAGLMAFMIGAGIFTTLFLYPGSPVQQAVPGDFLRHVGIGACMGVITFLIVSAIGQKTGAHINPAVTWSFYRQGKIGGWDAIFYTIAQFAGAIIAPIILLALIGTPFTDEKVKFATSQPGPQGVAAAFAAEFVISFILMLAVLFALSSKRLEKLAPAIIGVFIAVYITAVGPISGMSMNPARTLGSALTAGQYKGLWLYFVAPMAAMLLATEVYRRVRKDDQDDSGDHQPLPHFPIKKS
jgi:aquaporin Z